MKTYFKLDAVIQVNWIIPLPLPWNKASTWVMYHNVVPQSHKCHDILNSSYFPIITGTVLVGLMELIQLNYSMRIVGGYPPLSIILSYIVRVNVSEDSTIKHSVDHKPFYRTRTDDTRNYVDVKSVSISACIVMCVVFPFAMMKHAIAFISVSKWSL